MSEPIQNIELFGFEDELEQLFINVLEDQGMENCHGSEPSLEVRDHERTEVKIQIGEAFEDSLLSKPSSIGMLREYTTYDAEIQLTHYVPRVKGKLQNLRNRKRLSRFVLQRSRTQELFPESIMTHLVIKSIRTPGATNDQTVSGKTVDDVSTQTWEFQFDIKTEAFTSVTIT